MALTKDVKSLETEISKENVIEIEIPFPLFQYLSSNECNLQNICRICLSVSDPVLHPLFSSDEQSVLAAMVMVISEVQMSPDDGLPSSVCSKCHSEIMNYYEFKMKCVKSDYTLKSVLKGEFITDEKSLQNNGNCNLPTKTEPQKDNIIEENKSSNVYPEEPAKEEDIGVDILENIKGSMSNDEALCIVQETANNQKEITIIDKDPKTLYKIKPKRSSKKVKYKCTFCHKVFDKAKALRAHITKRHPDASLVVENQFPCKHCKESFESEFDLEVHGMLHNQGDGWKCAKCKKHFKDRAALRRHIERHMQRRRFVCEQCGAAFVEKYALRRHMRVHAPHAFEKTHACTQCDKRFAWRAALVAHMASHATTRDCVCNVCGMAFASTRLLASHERVHSTDKPYACTYCERKFRHESTRNTHVRTHTGERPYVCAQCGKAFIQHSNMTLHMRTHTGERPYACGVCERKFSSSSTLKAHSRTHTGERPYSCDICGKSFARVSMKAHMRVHSGDRPHACPAPACHKRFLTAHRLRDHYRLHTGEKPFECANCTEKFTTKCQLIKHIKRNEKKKNASKKGVMLVPVTVSDKDSPLITNLQTENKSDEYMIVDINESTNVPNMSENLCTVHETPIQQEGVIYQDDTNIKTEVIVLDSAPNLVTNSVFLNDVNYSNNDVNLVTVNEGEVSISAASATVDGATVKLYQYDQSLLQIHTGGGQLTISRISKNNMNSLKNPDLHTNITKAKVCY